MMEKSAMCEQSLTKLLSVGRQILNYLLIAGFFNKEVIHFALIQHLF